MQPEIFNFFRITFQFHKTCHSNHLAENRSIGTQERMFSAIEIAIMPNLATSRWISKESLIALLLASKLCFGNLMVNGIVDAGSERSRFVYSEFQKR